MGTPPAGRKPRPSELECIAYHEAGHAAASFALGRDVRQVTIVPDESDGSLGGCRNGAMPDFRPDVRDDPGTRALVEREVIILLAGEIAEAHFKGHHDDLGEEHDQSSACDLASHFCGSLEQTEEYIDRLYERARNLITGPLEWPGVEALAKALLESKTLGGRRARQVYRAGTQADLGVLS